MKSGTITGISRGKDGESVSIKIAHGGVLQGLGGTKRNNLVKSLVAPEASSSVRFVSINVFSAWLSMYDD